MKTDEMVVRAEAVKAAAALGARHEGGMIARHERYLQRSGWLR